MFQPAVESAAALSKQLDQTKRDDKAMRRTGTPQIEAASVDKLVEKLCGEKADDHEFMEQFFLTYPLFMTAEQLMHLLRMRYKLAPVRCRDNPQRTEEWQVCVRAVFS